MASPYALEIAECHAKGMTAPETASHLGLHAATIYKWAAKNGARFANRKKAPPRLTPEQEAVRKAAQKAAMQQRRDTPVNGWTWSQLAEAGFTVREAARLRGQTVPAVYAAERALGIKFYRVQILGLPPKERRRMHRVRCDYGVTRDTALEIIDRPDLIQPRVSEQVRQAALIKADPEAALLAMMRSAQ